MGANYNCSKICRNLSILLILATSLCVLSSCSSANNTGSGIPNPDNSTDIDKNAPSMIDIDLSAFEGDCGVSVKVDIEKESDSHLMDVNVLATNNSGKEISTLILYFVHCYDNDTALESRKYADKLKLENIPAGETPRGRWILGTTTLGAREYKVYVGYVLYADGSQWGNEDIDHTAVVTRGVEADVYAYGSGIKDVGDTVKKQYSVTYSARVIKNPSVGDSWSFGMKNGDTVFKPQEIITVSVPENRGPKLTIFANENDAAKDDFGQKDVLFTDISVGETETIVAQVIVTENDGRYIGNDAYVEFTITIKRIGSEPEKAENSKPTETTNSSANTGMMDMKNDSEIPAPHSHSYGSWASYDEAKHSRPCSLCNESEYEAHKWDNGTVTQAASCSQKGIIASACTVCKAEKYDSIPKVAHEWGNGTVTQNATCTQEGVMTYSCSACTAEKDDSIPKAEHEFSQKVEESKYLKSRATYTSGSVYYYSCICGEKGTDTFALNDKKEWISADKLKDSYGYSCGWMGEYIWLGRTDWDTNTRYNFKIYGSPTSRMESNVIYEGNLDGTLVRFKSVPSNTMGAGMLFFYDDLVAAGVIS